MTGQAPGEAALRADVVKACRIVFAAGCAGDGLGGHLSARLDGRRMLLKPRPASWRSLTPGDLITMDFDGLPDHSTVREWPIHAQIYRARPDVNCVLHAHPAASTLMAALGIAMEPLNQDCAGFAGKIPVYDNRGTSIHTVELGCEVARVLGDRRVVLLKNHGSVVIGRSVAEACVTAYRLERAAETMLRAAAIARLPVISREAQEAIMAARQSVEEAVGEDTQRERWRMLEDYYLNGD
ncbi:MAG: class II aldolase family protein [Terriglobia bacterium]|nr:MAG: class II aldolase family protein [Terriglobia bacterium]